MLVRLGESATEQCVEMAKFFRALTAEAVKVNYFVKVHSVELPNMRGVDEKDRFAVSLERGKRINITGDQPPLFEYTGDVGIDFDETLALDVTLYLNGEGVFEPKEGFISLLQRKKGALGLKKGKEGFKSSGTCKLQLHGEYADGAPHEVELPLQWCIAEGATVKMTITCNYLNGGPPKRLKMERAGGSSAPASRGAGGAKTESGFNVEDIDSMFTLPTSLSKTKKDDEYAAWGDNDEDIGTSPWEHGEEAAPDWGKSHSDSLAAELTGLEVDQSTDDIFSPSKSFSGPADNADFDSFSPSTRVEQQVREEEVEEAQTETQGVPGKDDVFSSFEPQAAPASTNPFPAKTSALAQNKPTPAPHGLVEIRADSCAKASPDELMMRFKLVLPRDVKQGDHINNIGGNKKINAVVPPGCKGGDCVILILPEKDMHCDEDLDEESRKISQKHAQQQQQQQSSQSGAPSSSSGATVHSATLAGNDEIVRLNDKLARTEKTLDEEREALSLYKEKAENEIQRLKAKLAATESMVSLASNQMTASGTASNKQDKAEIISLRSELFAIREKSAMLEALSEKASYYSSKVDEGEIVISAMKEENDRQLEAHLGMEARMRELESESTSLRQQLLDDKLSLAQLAAEAEDSRKSAATHKARAQALATKVAAMEVQVVEAELLKAELAAASNGNSSGHSNPPPMPSFLKKVATTVPTVLNPAAPVVTAASNLALPTPTVPSALPTTTAAKTQAPPPRPNFGTTSIPLAPLAGAAPVAISAPVVVPPKFPVFPAPSLFKEPAVPVTSGEGSLVESKVRRFYEKHNPKKVAEIPSILRKWSGRETELIQGLEQKYGKFEEEAGDESGDLC